MRAAASLPGHPIDGHDAIARGSDVARSPVSGNRRRLRKSAQTRTFGGIMRPDGRSARNGMRSVVKSAGTATNEPKDYAAA